MIFRMILGTSYTLQRLTDICWEFTGPFSSVYTMFLGYDLPPTPNPQSIIDGFEGGNWLKLGQTDFIPWEF